MSYRRRMMDDAIANGCPKDWAEDIFNVKASDFSNLEWHPGTFTTGNVPTDRSPDCLPDWGPCADGHVRGGAFWGHDAALTPTPVRTIPESYLRAIPKKHRARRVPDKAMSILLRECGDPIEAKFSIVE